MLFIYNYFNFFWKIMEELYNILIIGEKNSGKTSLHKAFLNNYQKNHNNIHLDELSKLFINKNSSLFIV